MIASAPKNMFVAKMGKNDEYGDRRMRKNMMANCFSIYFFNFRQD